MTKHYFDESLSAKWYAQQIINQFSISDPPIDVKGIISKLGIRYTEEDLGQVDCDGCFYQKNNKPLIIINKSTVFDSRKNFTAAHELGHYAIKEHSAESYNCTKSDMENFSYSKRKIEAEANTFAAELLMPDKIFISATKNRPFTFKTIEYIAETFGVSLSAAAIRYLNFNTNEKYAVVFSKDGNILWGTTTKGFKYSLRNKLIDKTYAYDAFDSCEPLPLEYKQVESYAWIADCDVPDDLNIQESSVYFNNINSVLSLLQIKVPEYEEFLEEF